MKKIFLFLIIVTVNCNMWGEEKSLDVLIAALDKAEFQSINLGVGDPYDNKQVLEILKYGKDAIPSLIDTVEHSHGIKQGYAAYCLMRFEYTGNDAIVASNNALKSALEDDYFSKMCINDYLKFCDTHKDAPK